MIKEKGGGLVKKQEKIDLLQECIQKTNICRCYFSDDPGYFYSYPMAVNEKFLLGYEEDDFILDGCFIRKISHLKKVEVKTDKCHEINKMFGVTDQLADPGIDISCWQSIFQALARLDTFIIIEDSVNGQFAIGTIQKVLKNKLYFKHFDANGVWDDGELVIPYSQITSVEWGSRYAVYWKRYFDEWNVSSVDASE